MHSFAQKKEMASATVRFITFFPTLMLLMHCTYAAAPPPPSFHHKQSTKTWCVAKPSVNEVALRANLEFACSESDCSAIQGSGGCSSQNGGVLLLLTSVAMNAYYQAKGRNSWNCFFNCTGLITITDPSKQAARLTSHARDADRGGEAPRVGVGEAGGVEGDTEVEVAGTEARAGSGASRKRNARAGGRSQRRRSGRRSGSVRRDDATPNTTASPWTAPAR